MDRLKGIAMLKEKDIAHESGNAWVLRDQKKNLYFVFVAGATHSVSDSAYPLDDDGLNLAIARAEYLGRKERS